MSAPKLYKREIFLLLSLIEKEIDDWYLDGGFSTWGTGSEYSQRLARLRAKLEKAVGE